MTEAPVLLRGRRQLSPIQRALYASQQRDPRAPMQNMVSLAHIDGPVDAERLGAAFASVVAATDILRTRIHTAADGATEVTLASTPASTEILDVDRADAARWAEERIATVIPVATCAYDSAVLRHEDGTVSWYLGLHHCVTDATTSTLVFRATAAAYAGEEPSLGSYYEWAREVERPHPASDRARAHWQERRPAPRLGHLYERNLPSTARSTRVPVPLDEQFEGRIAEQLASTYRLLTTDLAWSALLLTATAAYLHRVTGSDQFALGLPVHNRSSPSAREVPGPLVEVFPVDVEIEADDTFVELHRRVGRSLTTTLANAQPATAPPGNDIEAVVNVVPEADVADFAGMPATFGYVHAGAADRSHLLRVQLFRYSGTELALDLNASAVRADDGAPRAAEHFATVLRAAVEEPEARIDGAPVLTAAEAEVMDRWGTGPTAVADPPLVVSRLRDALSGASQVALSDGGREWTGDELWRRVEEVGADLQARGVGPGSRVAVEMERSADAVIAIYAVLAAGGSYVPIDPSQPDARRARLIERAGCIVTIRTLPVSDGADERRGLRPVAVGPDDEAYLLFTSGSTGEPKGVPISHRGLADYLAFAVDSYLVGAEPPVVAFFSALTFDLTVTSLFLASVAGGRLAVIRGDGPTALSAIAEDPTLTWCKATPSHLEILERLLPAEHGLDTLVVGGEAFVAPLAERLRRARPGLRIFNEYGPTEAVVGCMIHEAIAGNHPNSPEVPIGRPAPGVSLRVVDRALHPVPLGAVGELLISHRGLTAGYLDEDSDAFLVRDGVRWYRSGDLVRMLDDETLVYLRRIDEQLKVGGIRLDPSEVEAALASHPLVRRAAVRPWAPASRPATRYCTRCGLADNVPGVVFDDQDVCDRCLAYEEVKAQAEAWFRTPEDLLALRDRAREERTGAFDCIALLSGGKDSTYVVYQLVAMGFDVHALTLDNGFISDEAKQNVAQTVAHLGISHEFATSDAMNAIFRDSLERFSNVCQGCFKTIYTLATNRAVELGAPLIVTGLSRGQFFETRLTPEQFRADRFDPDAIDAAVLAARKAYHRMDDAATRLLDTRVFETDDVFDRVTYVDFYRYVDVALSEMLRFLENDAPWVRPTDTGRSTNCRINAAGIQTHLEEQGYHNYAEPYAWDVRLGHKQRDEALAELDDRDDAAEVAAMLAEVDYTPRRREILTAWIEATDQERLPSPAELRAHAQQLLPTYAVPDAFVVVDELAMTANGKLDVAALPAPERAHRSSAGMVLAPTTPLERAVVALWERQLRVEPISIDDDYFALGGDSLGAIEMAILLSTELEAVIPDAVAFANATPRQLAAAVAGLLDDAEDEGGQDAGAPSRGPTRGEVGRPPVLSAGEQAMSFEAHLRPDDPRYNQGRIYHVRGVVDAGRLQRAARQVADRHEPLHWTFSSPRRRLAPADAVLFDAGPPMSADAAADRARRVHRAPFDLDHGPLLRVDVVPIEDLSPGEVVTQITLVAHHISTDESSFDRLWVELESAAHGVELPALEVGYGDHTRWQSSLDSGAAAAFWPARLGAPTILPFASPGPVAADGLRQRQTALAAAELRRAEGASPFAAVLAALALMLERLTGDEEIQIGALASTRDHPSAKNLIGYYLNTLPIRFEVTPGATLDELRLACGARWNDALSHRAHPFAETVAAQRAAGRPDPTPRVLVTLQEIDALRFGELETAQEILFTGSAVADATFFVQLRDDRVEIALEHRGSTVDAAAADLLLAALEDALTAVLRHPHLTVGVWNPVPVDGEVLTGPEAADGLHILDSFRAQVIGAPEAVAVRCGEEVTTYAELDRWSDRIAGRLVAAGVEGGDRVGMGVGRSGAAIAAIVGVHKAGAAYVPVDLEYPPERNRAVLAASGAAIALVEAVDEDHPVFTDVETMAVPHAPPPTPTTSAAIDLPVPSLEAEAYVIYTSGSTGAPRGVAIDHQRLAASTAARALVYEDDPDDFLLLSSFAFDSSVAGLFWALSTGAALTVPTRSEAHDVDALSDLFRSGVSHTLLVPSLYAAVIGRAEAGGSWPRQVIVAGEACGAELVAAHHRNHPGSRLMNEYGPTEGTVWTTAAPLLEGESRPPIGRPIPGTWAAVVDRRGRLCPPGVVGELLIGGSHIVTGYEGESSDRFVGDSEFGSGGVFATGDLASMVAGRLYFHGRADDQLNVGGVRIEPAEIERALASVDHVRHVVAVGADPRPLAARISAASPDRLRVAMRDSADDEDPSGALAAALDDPASAVIVAHVEHDGTPPDRAGLEAAARASLPPAARPARYQLHERLPRTASGKIDRRATAALAVAGDSTPVPVRVASAGPDDADELALFVELARRALAARGRDRPELGPDDDFFDAGGDSLAALELFHLIEERTGIRSRVSILFEARTPRVLLHALGEHHLRVESAVGQAVVINEGRPGSAPIWLLPGAGGVALVFQELVAALGADRRVLSVEYPGTRGEREPHETIEALGADIHATVRAAQPEGPYRFLGYSLGGLVAVDLARRFAEAGQRTEYLGAIEAGLPGVGDSRSRREIYRDTYRAGGMRAVAGRATEKVRGRLRRAPEKAGRQIRSRLERVALERFQLRPSDRYLFIRMLEVSRAAGLRYRPPTIDAPVHLYMGGDATAEWRRSMTEAWTDVAAGGLHVRITPGSHVDNEVLVDPAHARALGALVSEDLDLR